MSEIKEFAARVQAAADAGVTATITPMAKAQAPSARRVADWRELVGPEAVEEMLLAEPAVSTAEPAWRETVADGGSLAGLLPRGMDGSGIDAVVRRARLTEGGMPAVVEEPAWRELVGAETAASMLGRS